MLEEVLCCVVDGLLTRSVIVERLSPVIPWLERTLETEFAVVFSCLDEF
jgi:hypothetical protein